MSMGATSETPVPPAQAYSLEMRREHIRQHIQWSLANGQLVRPGHVANTYGNGMISKTDVLADLAKFSELGGGK